MLKFAARCHFYIAVLQLMPVLSSASSDTGYHYLYPSPNSTRVPVEAEMIIRPQHFAPKDLRNPDTFVEVFERKSGLIDGSIRSASDGKTIIFTPASSLPEGCVIRVTLKPEIRTSSPYGSEIFTFKFTTLRADECLPNINIDNDWGQEIPTRSKSIATEKARIMPNGVSVPSDFPHIRVTVNKETADGHIFINNWRNARPYNIIFDNDGSPVWYECRPDGDRRRDFKVQKNGTITMLTRNGQDRFLGYDMNFNLINEYNAGGGYSTDEHELQVLENGHYLIIGRRNVQVDMSRIVEGGNPNASIRETTVQEFTPEHDMIFNWPALEHLKESLPYLELQDLRGSSINYPHMNAIDVDLLDGHLLLSSRHLSEVTKINRQTGEIIWRLGGAHNQFIFVNDPLDGFYNQHDIRSLGDGLYSVFDNGNGRDPQRSRAVIYKLDTQAKTATMVWEFRNPDGTSYSHYMGNFQKLPNGNSLINWAVGDRPKATEVTPAGEVVYEMNFEKAYRTYRTFRFPWTGAVEKPRLYVEQENNSLVLIYNKFGDKDVDYYKIYGDTQPHPSVLVDTSRATLKKITGLMNGQRYYFRVTAVGKDGVEGDYSNEQDIEVNFVDPGRNMIRNGDFIDGTEFWDFAATESDASIQVTADGELCVQVEQAGTESWHIQLRQRNLPLFIGESYRLEFDAYAAVNRPIEAQLERASEPQTNYSRINPIALRRGKQHFAFEFLMQEPSDFYANVVFNCGLASGDVFIDNISLNHIEREIKIEDLPAPWSHRDVGSVNLPGLAGIWHDCYVLRGSGDDIWNTSDQFHFVYQQIKGDVEILARVLSIDETDDWAKAGLMIRNSMGPGSAHAMMCATVSNGMAFQRRVTENSTSQNTSVAGLKVPYWVKLVRNGNNFAGYESADGERWTIVDEARIEMDESAYIGLVVTSHNNDAMCESIFEGVLIENSTHALQPGLPFIDSFVLHPAFPNPFNPKTTIQYFLPAPAAIRLEVYNIRGELVQVLVNAKRVTGLHRVEFDATDSSSGLYFYELSAVSTLGNRYHAIGKMTVVK